MKYLNLGCGLDIRNGWVNVDYKENGQEVMHDLNNVPYPFKDDSFDVVLMQDIIEHVRDPKGALSEVYRICKNDATVVIRTPHPHSPLMKKDPEHVSPIEPSFLEHFTAFPSVVVYYHIQKGKPLGLLPVRYWNQTCVLKVIKHG